MPQHMAPTEDETIWHMFRDIDDAANLDLLAEKARSNSTTNFVVSFSQSMALCAFDLSAHSIERLLDTSEPNGASTRWINIWAPFKQRPLLELLAKRYEFSPRLLALICSDPLASGHKKPTPYTPNALQVPTWSRTEKPELNKDPEKGTDPGGLADDASTSSSASAVRGNLYQIVDNVWHYVSVDFARSYVCVGYNSLYDTKSSGDDSTDEPLPHCIRIWTWLILCDDNTVVSITEDPFPQALSAQLSDTQDRVLAETRRNIVNVFRSLSLVDSGPLATNNPLKLLPIRRTSNASPDDKGNGTSDAPSLLFYYIFENWQNSYTLVNRRESRFGIELAALRAEMFVRPRLRHIDRLDCLGRELGVLRRHFDAHKRIIDRVIEARGPAATGLQTVRVVNELVPSASHSEDVRSAVVVTSGDCSYGVSLNTAARMRFKRLRDLIDVYASNEVEAYIKQKEELVAMNFNLIAIRQSSDVERLTRITLLLTKITILFTPISLMTGYFSVELENVSFTLPSYWISFGVVLSLSLLSLVLLGVFSGSLQTFEVLQGIWKGLRRTHAHLIRHRKR